MLDSTLRFTEAMFYENVDERNVQCLLCPRECVILDGKRGFCRNRENQKGKLYTVVYGKPSVVDIGPIEKAPLYHFVPGHSRLCLTCASCNLTQLPPTPISTLESAYEIAKRNGLRYTYIGNVPGHIHNSTFCPSCNKRIIHRIHFDILEMNVINGKCTFCNSPIEGRWE